MPAGGLKVASLPRRLAAASIDAPVVAVPLIGGGMGIGLLYARWRGREADGLPKPEIFRPGHPALAGLSLALEIGMRNRRGPGYRALGLRRLDIRTGGPVSVHSAVVQSVAKHTLSQSIRVLQRPREQRRHERLAAAQAEMKAVRRAHADDPEAIERELRDVFKRHHVSPIRGCLLPLSPLLLADLLALCSPLHQTLSERFAGIVVVED